LIGFDNKLNALSDTSNILQGGEIGSGHTLMAVLEVEPAQPTADSNASRNPVATVCLHYQQPSADSASRESYLVPYHYTHFVNLPRSYRFATSVALFGSLLKKSHFTEKSSWEDLTKMATESYDVNDASQKEFLGLVEKAKKIYHKNRKKKTEP
jgi:Ca-activated chloride channel homolog